MISSLTAEQRTGLFFFSQFIAGGTANAYAGIWLTEQGLSATQIGLVNSVPIAILLAINIFVGRIADRASDWRQVIFWGAVVSGVSAFGLFGAAGFVPILIVFAITAVSQSMIVPVADAAALHLMSSSGGSLGGMRGLSTLGYLLGLLVSGFLLGHFGSWLFVPLFVGFSLLRTGGAALLPRFKAEIVTTAISEHRFSDFLRPWLLLPLLGWAIVYATHLVLNGFQSLLWFQQGYSTTIVSLLIAVGGVSEAVAFFLYKPISKHVRARILILISGIVTIGRWFAMSAEPPLYGLIALQLLHGITFALGMVACITYIGRNTSVSVAAEAQSFFLVLQQISAIAAITIFSMLAEQDGSGAYFGNAIMACIGTAVIVLGLAMKKSEVTVTNTST